MKKSNRVEISQVVNYQAGRLAKCIMVAAISMGLLTSPLAHAGLFDMLKRLVNGSAVFTLPPEDTNLAKYHVINLSTGNGAGSAAMLDYLEGRLADTKVGSKPYYAKIYRNANLKTPAFEFAVIQVDVGQSNGSQQASTEVRVQCPRGKMVCNDRDAAHYNVNCLTRSVVMPISITVRDGASGSPLWSERQPAKAESKVCSDTGGTLKEVNELQAENIASTGTKLLSKFAPRSDKRALELVGEHDSIKDMAADQLKAAYELASKQDMTNACKVYDDMRKTMPDNGAILFNAAYCKQSVGYFAEAKELYEAATLDNRAPKELISKYLEETNTWLAKGFQSLLVEISPQQLAKAEMPQAPQSPAPAAIPLNTAAQPAPTPAVANPVVKTHVTAATSADAPVVDTAQRIRQLKSLYEEGILSKPQYEQKKKQLLEQL